MSDMINEARSNLDDELVIYLYIVLAKGITARQN